jgi:hypothetical protein
MTSQAVRLAGRNDRRAAPITLVALIFVVALLALNGAGLALSSLLSGALARPAPAIGVPLATSFGTFTVAHAQTIDGLTSRDMWNGMTHGIQDLVLTGSAQVDVAVAITNDGPDAIRVAPAQFGLLVAGSPATLAPTGTTIETTRLAPGASIEAAFTFVVPQDGQELTFVYTDPGTNLALEVPVGAVGVAPPAIEDDHH